MRDRLSHIHYVNQLWHLSIETQQASATSFFARRKSDLQNELLEVSGPAIYLEHDVETSQESGRRSYVIRVQAEDRLLDACHIPEDRVEPRLLQRLRQEGRVR